MIHEYIHIYIYHLILVAARCQTLTIHIAKAGIIKLPTFNVNKNTPDF